jgi:ADP-dependent NAD(P)H-hydrate dehydratase / NAD(P)H-hydrate epimerase
MADQINPYLQKQTTEKPLFAELLWSRPETKAHAGKLLIIGGNSWGFSAPANAYDEAIKAGIGSARVLLPAAVHKVVGHVIANAESAASTPSGSFSQSGLAEFLEQAEWADGVLLAGDLGRNSETAIVIEQFLTKFNGQVTITKDAIDYAINIPKVVANRPDTTLVLSLGQLQKLATALHFEHAITSSMDFIRLVDALGTFTELHKINIIVKHYQNIIVGVNGLVSSTKLNEDLPVWRIKTAAHAAVWWLQNPQKAYEAMTTSLLEDSKVA